MKTVLIGAGNVATHLGPALQTAGCRIEQVWSHTRESASRLADRLDCAWTCDEMEVLSDAELYVFSVRDAVLEDVARRVYDHLLDVRSFSAEENAGADALFVHTAGSMSADALPAPRRGVLYPMQTFSKNRAADFRRIPIFVESETDEALLMSLGEQISDRVLTLDGENRRILHLAAVFACNFTNHMYDLASRLLADHGIPFSVLLPLIDETVAKVHDMAPRDAQTGPAVRYDENVMRRQLAMLSDAQTAEIYKLLSQSIHDKLRPEEN